MSTIQFLEATAWVRGAWDKLLDLSRRESVLVAIAGAGFALAAVAGAVLVWRGGAVGLEGDVPKAMTFNFAVAVYVLTLAILLPLAKMSKRMRGYWIAATTVLIAYFYAAENVQVYRGIDPRFTEVGSTLDGAVSAIFGVVAVLVIVLFLVLAARFLRPALDDRDGLLLLGVRYGSGGAVAAFAGGVVMSVIRGSEVGNGGNLLPMHALGFHALQAIPTVAWLLAAEPVVAHRTLYVHLAGIAWLVACAAAAWQAVAGNHPLDLSPANLVLAIALLSWWALAIWSVIRLLRGNSQLSPKQLANPT